MLAVPDGHRVFWEVRGPPEGTPVVLVHGGPGSGCAGMAAGLALHTRGLRTVAVDQRGCGRSLPSAADTMAALTANTTGHLVDDLERLREHLGIERWMVVGASWGVTLALAYAQRHAQRVLAMVLASVTTGSRREVDWVTRAVGRVFPLEWEAFVAGVPERERDGDLSAAYARLLADPDPDVRARAARDWCAWEDTHVSLAPGWSPDARYADPRFRLAFARLVTHYWSHGCFLADGELLAGMPALAGVPAVLVHGRYDVSGPLDTAVAVHRAWPGSRLVVADAGHGTGGLRDEVLRAVDALRG